MKSNLLLIYWTGTYNTRYITNLLFENLKENFEIDIKEINGTHNDLINIEKYDVIGIGYPIYGFNIPGFFLKYLKKLKYKKEQKVFIYKNSGETLSANDASSYPIVDYLKRRKIVVTNEYHFVMPYNIHFKYEDGVTHEMLKMDDKLAYILKYELINNIKNLNKYSFLNRLITFFVGIIHIAGPINSFFYKVDSNKCIDCGLCIKNCPMNNIYINKSKKVKFKHKCEMCMRCSFFCPKNAIKIGFLEGWKCNGSYDLSSIYKKDFEMPFVNIKMDKHYHCLLKNYSEINRKYSCYKKTLK